MLLPVPRADPAIGSIPRADRSGAGLSAATPLNLSALSWLSRSDVSAGRSGALSTSASSWDYRDGSLSQAASPQLAARDRLWGHRGSPYAQVSGRASRGLGYWFVFVRNRDPLVMVWSWKGLYENGLL